MAAIVCYKITLICQLPSLIGALLTLNHLSKFYKVLHRDLAYLTYTVADLFALFIINLGHFTTLDC